MNKETSGDKKTFRKLGKLGKLGKLEKLGEKKVQVASERFNVYR